MPRRHQPLEHPPGENPVPAAVDRHEVRRRRQRAEPVRRRDLPDPRPRAAHLRHHLRQPAGVAERRQRARHGERVDPEMVAHPVEGGDELGMPEPVADARPGHPVRLGEGAHADHPRLAHVERRERARRREVGIGLVEAEDAPARQPRHHLGDPRPLEPAPHRVVRVGEVEERRARLARGEKQRLGVLGVVAVGHGEKRPPEPRHVVVEGRVGPGRGHDRRPRRHEEPHQVAEQPVDPLAHGHVLRPHPVLRRQRRLELVELRIGVLPDLPRRRRHRGDRPRRRPEDALVRPDPRREPPAHGALLRLRPDEGHGRGQAGGEGRQAHGPEH